MSRERSKAVRIMGELIGYFFRHEIYDLEMELHYDTEEVRVSAKGPCAERPLDLDALEDVLNAPRQVELEEYYAELLGGRSFREELGLLGSMVDASEIRYEEGTLSIALVRRGGKVADRRAREDT